MSSPQVFQGLPVSSAAPPHEDFDKFVNEEWKKQNPIPGDQSTWGVLHQLNDNVLKNLRELIAENAEGTVALFRDVFDDTENSERSALSALAPLFAAVDRATSSAAADSSSSIAAPLLGVIAHLHHAGVGAAFSFEPSIDARNSSMVVASLAEEGGLSLPDKDYYEKEEKADLRAKFLAATTELLTLSKLASSPEEAADAAKLVLELETEMSQAQWTRTEKRDPIKTYNKLSLAELREKSGLDWHRLFFEAHTPGLLPADGFILINHPEYFTEFLPRLLGDKTKLRHWNWYLKHYIVRSLASHTTQALDEAHFNFYGRTLQGQKEQQPRWKRFVNLANSLLRDEVGKLYVAKFFPPAAKQEIRDLVDFIKTALVSRINELTWMSPETKIKAIAKLNMMNVKVGYPDIWEDYSEATLSRSEPLVSAVLALRGARERREMRRINRAVDKHRWEMPCQMVNAYFHPEMNEIVFPAAILQQPLFSFGDALDAAVNFGAIGAVIGHEITHALDDQGRQYDGHGNLNDWWTETDAKNFVERAEIMIQQFNNYKVGAKQISVNGKLTVGENIADLGGLKISFQALADYLNKKGRTYTEREGWSPEQRFFLSWSRTWATNIRPEREEQLLIIDPHSPAFLRVNGPLSAMHEFHALFNIKENTPMHLPVDKRPEIW